MGRHGMTHGSFSGAFIGALRTEPQCPTRKSGLAVALSPSAREVSEGRGGSLGCVWVPCLRANVAFRLGHRSFA
jgi:hypothetical protein